MDTRKVSKTSRKPIEASVVVADVVTEAFEEREAVPSGAGRLDPEFRHELIQRTAYAFAEQRGFEPGHELDDWLEAEAEIDAQLGARASALDG